MKPANDNTPRTLAEQLTALLEYRNRPDSPPDPLQSNWNTDPSTVINDGAFDDEDEPEHLAEDLLLEITPSIAQIRRQMGKQIVRNESKQIVSIGTLRFSDGSQHERVTVNGATGVETKQVKSRVGAMLGASEKLGAAHGGVSPQVVTISNSYLTGMMTGFERDADGRPTGRPLRHQPYTTGVRARRKGKSLTAAQSRALIAEAIANTPVLPPVKHCPPGVASGTARFSDQFVGMKIGSTGKGGAPNWVDEFMAIRDFEEWQESVRALEPKHRMVLDAAMKARSLMDISPGGSARGARKRGKRLLVAANDNFVNAIKKVA